MKRGLLLIFAVICCAFACKAQNWGYYDNETHVCWSKEGKLIEEDYKGDSLDIPKGAEFWREMGINAIASAELWSAVDIPNDKAKSDGDTKEIIYVVPVLEKETSYILKYGDTLSMRNQQLRFDMYELAARMVRKRLQSFQESAGENPDSILTRDIELKMFLTVKNDIEDTRDEMGQRFTEEVMVQRYPGSYEKWRKLIDYNLDGLKEFATTAKDRERFIKKAPLIKGYVEEKDLWPDMDVERSMRKNMQ